MIFLIRNNFIRSLINNYINIFKVDLDAVRKYSEHSTKSSKNIETLYS